MSRPQLFALASLWLIVITYLVNSIVVYDETAGLTVNNPIQQFDDDLSSQSTVEQSVSLISVYFNAMTFNIEGLPWIVNLFILAPSLIIGAIVVEYIIEILPF